MQRQRELLAQRPPDEAELRARAAEQGPRRGFRAALVAGPRPALIAECKRRSPVLGLLRDDYNVRELAAAYQRAGASAISVLTSADFDGAPEHLLEAREAATLPVLRKDFLLEPVQVIESAALGADCVLLIARLLPRQRLKEMVAQAHELGMETLVEIHTAAELPAALASGTDVLGVNRRDLATFHVREGLLPAAAKKVPADLPLVCESGIKSRADVALASMNGATAVLVGEALVTCPDPEAKARELLGLT